MSSHSALVVGAASGIGKAAATVLAGLGVQVTCADRDVEGVKDLAKDLRSTGAVAVASFIEVEDAQSVGECVAQAHEQTGRIEILVNCAGTTGVTGRPSHEIEVEDFDTVCRVNLRGAFLLSRSVLPVMIEQGYGRILHVASIAGKEGNAGMVSYSASKAGLIGMVKAQGKEYATTGVTVNALAPAVIQTPMVDALPQHQVDYMTERIPMGRTGSLAEVADMICWITSPACSFTTGFTFDLSGGRAVY